MRKSTKIAVVLAAAALLVAGFAFTTLAKGWVKEAEGLYYYEDAYGMKEYMTWEKDGANYYYLGEDGYMVANKLVDFEGNYYWCGADGAKVINQWVQVPADEMDQEELEVEYRWYYFDSKGRAYKGAKKTVDGKTYFFDASGKMLYGYVDGTNFQMKKDFDASYKFFCGTNDEGWARKSEWKKETDVDNKYAYEDESSFWTYYKSNGEKADASNAVNGVLIGGVRYYFDDDGGMLTGWQTANTTDPAATWSEYFGGADDGKMVKKGWVYAVPKSGKDKDDGTSRWFWFQNNGVALKFEDGGVARINGRFYAFAAELDNASKMLSGMVKVTVDPTKTLPEADEATSTLPLTAADVTADAWMKDPLFGEDWAIYYFSGDEKNDGSLKKNTTFVQSFLDDDYTINVDKEGKLSNGYIAKRYYKNGILVKASEDYRYEIKNVWFWDETSKSWETKNVLVSVAGTETTKGYVADADGSYYTVKDGKIYKADSSLVAPGQAASAVYNDKKVVTAEGYDYDVVTTLVYDNVYKITLANGRVHK